MTLLYLILLVSAVGVIFYVIGKKKCCVSNPPVPPEQPKQSEQPKQPERDEWPTPPSIPPQTM